MDPVSLSSAAQGASAFKGLMSTTLALVRNANARKKIQKNIDTLYRRIGEVRQVKTIWQIDRPVDLADFYCHPHVQVGHDRKIVERLYDLGDDDHILIEGIAGQGKSIFLRFLCDVELGGGEYIPIFVELGRISEGYSLMDRILAAFRALELPGDTSFFDRLAKSGKLLLLLDAFDEIPDILKHKAVTDLQDLAMTYRAVRLLVTSRPHEAIANSPSFTRVHLDNLRGDEYIQVITRLSEGEEWRNTLLSHLDECADHIKELLCTPLIVTLLILTYKATKTLPANLSEFYQSLFPVLLTRHDGSKPGISRPRKCNLSDSEYREVFNALCFLCKVKGRGARQLGTREMHALTKDALMETHHKANAEAYVKDIVRITCLILREGDEHRFIHKTVLEYHAAAFIASKPEKWSRSLYDRLARHSDDAWVQELAFLEEIDVDRYRQYYRLPMCLHSIGVEEKELTSETPSDFNACIRRFASWFEVEWFSEGGYKLRLRRRALHGWFEEGEHRDLMTNCISAATPFADSAREGPVVRLLSDFMEIPTVASVLHQKLRPVIDRIWNQAKELKTEIDRSEDDSLLSMLDLLSND